jgi:hypothetical protein
MRWPCLLTSQCSLAHLRAVIFVFILAQFLAPSMPGSVERSGALAPHGMCPAKPVCNAFQTLSAVFCSL